MKVISLSGASKLHLKNSCVAIGIFDGVHRGHQYLIRQMVTKARQLQATAVVITFFPHPAHVFDWSSPLKYLISLEERLGFLSDLGVETCLIVRFDRAFARIQPQKFIKDILVGGLDVKAVFVGENFKFGKDRSGDVALFQSLAARYHYEMHAVPGVKIGGEIISSSRIRQLIVEGKLNKAARLLGREVSISGAVVKGDGRGRKLGFPTANIDIESSDPLLKKYPPLILPPQGVYVVQASLGSRSYPAIANIGIRPSFVGPKSKMLLEVHIFDFSKNIYGKNVKVEFLKKIRNEKKFSSPQALVQQIQKDAVLVRKYLAISATCSVFT